MWVLAGLLLALGFAIWVVTAERRKSVRLLRAEDGRDDEKCWLCGHRKLERVASETYRCLACGGLQGEQAAMLKEAARRAAFARMSVGERRKHAGLLLYESKLELLALDEEVQHVLTLSVADVHNHNSDGGAEKISRFGQLLLGIGMLEQKLIDVAVVLASPQQLHRLAIDLTSMNALLDKLELRLSWQSSQYGGSIGLTGADRQAHESIVHAGKHLVELRSLYDDLSARFAAFSE